MMVLSLCRQLCPDKIPVVVGKRLGDGADGEAFEIEDDPSKVIKFCVLYDRVFQPIDSHYKKKIAPIIDGLITNPVDVCARVYAHEYMGSYSRDWVGSTNKLNYHNDSRGKQKFLLYYYTMEKLYKISEDESKVFHSILSHEDKGINKNYPLDKIREMLVGMHRGLDFDEERVIFFCERLRLASISHNDIHPRNIMKDSVGNFKLIDFDRVELNGE